MNHLVAILVLISVVLLKAEVLLSIGPRTSMQTGKKSIEGRAPSYFLIFSSDALVAAKSLSLLVKCTYRSLMCPERLRPTPGTYRLSKESMCSHPGVFHPARKFPRAL
ncbi:hypothetical protein HELRODRAFT_178121 [Helobdella robusta]|uniref:Secreted protein n=1 Tax=Helobdella robusta TaxID=6412 RepID=T1FCS1_HELRO|nr:hypothetical protein HELRODRAFT_178121 [Helobdella robusta]ESN97334.1 hypothetical protein HELRODRAFT_178121 [Helobdella robusta]